MHAPAIGPAIDLVFFESHRLTNQNDFAAAYAAYDADIVLRIIRPALKDPSQIYDFHDESLYRDTARFAADNHVALEVADQHPLWLFVISIRARSPETFISPQ